MTLMEPHSLTRVLDLIQLGATWIFWMTGRPGSGSPPPTVVPEIPYEPLSRRWLASSQFV